MSYKLNWFGKEFHEYFVSGAITENFDIETQNDNLIKLAESEKDIIALFKDFDRMLILVGFKEYDTSNEEEEEFGYLLDEEMVEMVLAHKDEPDLSLMVGIIALQYFQFDTLEDIIMLDEADLESLDEEDRKEIEEIQQVFKEMPEAERESFLEQELFYYDEEELKAWLTSHS